MKCTAGFGRSWHTSQHLQASYYLEVFKIFSLRVLRRLRVKCLWFDSEREEVQAFLLQAVSVVAEEGHRCQLWAFKAGYVKLSCRNISIIMNIAILVLLFIFDDYLKSRYRASQCLEKSHCQLEHFQGWLSFRLFHIIYHFLCLLCPCY